MRIFKDTIIYSIIFWLNIFLGGCQPIFQTQTPTKPYPQPTATQVSTLTPSQAITISISPSPTATLTPTPYPTLTPGPTFTPTITLIPKMDSTRAEKEMQEHLFKKSCLFPCWWGIVPGKTDVYEAFNYFSSITNVLPSDISDIRKSNSFGFNFQIPSTGKKLGSSFGLFHDGRKIKYIGILYDPNDARMGFKGYTIQEIFNEYGKPDYIYFFIPGIASNGEIPVQAYLFYSTYQIKIYFYKLLPKGSVQQGNIGFCFNGKVDLEIGLWWDKFELSDYSQFKPGKILYKSSIEPFRPIEDISSYTTESIFNSLRISGMNPCVTLPMKPWIP